MICLNKQTTNKQKPSSLFAHLLLLVLLAAYLTLFSSPLYAELKNFQAADVVVGQKDFTSGSRDQGGSAGANTLDLPKSVFSDGTRLIISESANHRVLIYNSIPTTNNAAADVVVGQPDFTTTSAGTTAQKMSQPHDAWVAGGKLFVVDQSNSRVLIYNRIPTTNGAAADVVVGQSNFTSGGSDGAGTAAPNTLENPAGVWSDGVKLIIGDNENHRVLIFNRVPTVNNASADIVIGAPNFTTDSSGCAANKFSSVQGVISDGKRLITAEWGNARILIWNSIPTANNALPDVVVGQKNFTSCTANQGGSARSNTLGANNQKPFIDGNKLYTIDRNNNRVLIWNRIPTENNAAADIVIGQPDFTTTSAGTTASKLTTPRAVFYNGKRLFIADEGNSRVLIYNLSTSAIDLSPQFKQGKAVLGKVFWDLNGNGRQDAPRHPEEARSADEGSQGRDPSAASRLQDDEQIESGIEGVRVVSDTGIYAITDHDGKYHFPYIETGQRLLKIDPSTLPEGAITTTESPRKVTVTEGILTKVSFGVKPKEEGQGARVMGQEEGNQASSSPNPLTPDPSPFLEVSISQDPTKLEPRLSISAEILRPSGPQDDGERIRFTIDCNYYRFIERADLKLYDQNYALLTSRPLPKPLPLYYELPKDQIPTNMPESVLYYQLSVYDKEGHEDRTGAGTLRFQ